ncbi:MAG TPA: lipase family protein [Candidatus Corynebacterium gallistercoris]|uniref:Lipase family protein n=1 Tax=Candidatus Corynebacterium gallistercoris TaxID=2838530 RepID=A0A9D1RY45_9CORY|nr:lipase family protein [Candidatus Corynebacterium gallistercoris]
MKLSQSKPLAASLVAILAFSTNLYAGLDTAVAQPGSSLGQSAGALGSVAYLTPPQAVNPGQALREPAPWSGANRNSGLDLAESQSPPPGAVAGEPLRQVPLNPAVGLANAGQQFRFSYTTTDQHGAIATSTAALFTPQGHPPKGGWPVLAWAHGTVGLADQCTPSMNPRSDRDAAYLNHWLEQGYAIVASDYAGLGTPGLMSYLNGTATAASMVDSVIAAHKLSTPAVQLSHKWAVIGQSQGGGAALHVAQSASARSVPAGLDYVGAVATGAPAYIEELVLAAGPTFPPVPLPAALNAYAGYIVAGFREARPNIDVDSVLTDEGKRWVAAAETACYTELADAVRGMNVARAFSSPLSSVPGLEPALREYMETPATGYDKPVFLAHGMKDIDVPSPIGIMLNSSMWINQFIGAEGTRNNRVEVHWYPTDHGQTVPVSLADSTPFLRGLFG